MQMSDEIYFAFRLSCALLTVGDAAVTGRAFLSIAWKNALV